MLIEFSLAVLGFFAGLLLWSRIVYVSAAVYSAIRKVDLRSPGPLNVSKLLKILVPSACAWLLAFGGIATHFALQGASSSGWAAFFAGMAATPFAIAYTTSRALRRIHQLKAGVQP